MQSTCKRTRFLTVFLSSALLVAMVPMYSAHAASSSDLSSVKNKKSSVASQIEEQESKVKDQQSKLDTLQSSIDKKTEEVASTKQDLSETKEALKTRKEDLKARVRVMYKTGSAGYVDVLLNSESMSDLFSNIEMVKKIYQADQKAMNDIQKQEAELKEQQQQLEDEQKSLSDQKDKLEEEKKSLDSALAELQKEYDKLDAEESSIESQIRATESAGQVTTSKGTTVKIPSSSNSGSSGSSSSSSSSGSSTGVSSSRVLSWPCSGLITCEFGQVNGMHSKGHSGMDIAAAYGTPIKACADGVVTQAGWNNSFGNYIVINHGNGISTLYGHNSSLNVSVGQVVSRGQVIARMGSTGYSSGNHCHLSVYVNGSLVNPRNYLG
ncbi:MAG: peptidoglycan DD-metalloendopeptidase family protein [Eubacteriales bacterium]|nr:peptidoglycan DD-metalloendopeptidase family protein [Eubacteriales bacterium]